MSRNTYIPDGAKEKFESLVATAEQATRLGREYIMTTRRYPTIVWRYAIIAVLRDYGITVTAIGALVGKTHTDVIYCLRKVDDWLPEGRTADPELQKAYKVLSAIPTEGDAPLFTRPSLIRRWLEGEGVEREVVDGLMERIGEVIIR